MIDHTPTPWKTVTEQGFGTKKAIRIHDGHLRVAEICINRSIYASGPSDIEKANAAFVVRACNAHDALMKAVTKARAEAYDRVVDADGDEDRDRYRAAKAYVAELDAVLTLAKGGA